jgi:hypothetical protein
VRFFKSNRSSWVAKVRSASGIFKIYEYPEHNELVIFAKGCAYIIDPDYPDKFLPIGCATDAVIATKDKSLIYPTGTAVILLNNNTGELW